MCERELLSSILFQLCGLGKPPLTVAEITALHGTSKKLALHKFEEFPETPDTKKLKEQHRGKLEDYFEPRLEYYKTANEMKNTMKQNARLNEAAVAVATEIAKVVANKVTGRVADSLLDKIRPGCDAKKNDSDSSGKSNGGSVSLVEICGILKPLIEVFGKDTQASSSAKPQAAPHTKDK